MILARSLGRLVVLTCLAAVGCAGSTSRQGALSLDETNVLLIVVDTLGAGHLGHTTDLPS